MEEERWRFRPWMIPAARSLLTKQGPHLGAALTAISRPAAAAKEGGDFRSRHRLTLMTGHGARIAKQDDHRNREGSAVAASRRWRERPGQGRACFAILVG